MRPNKLYVSTTEGRGGDNRDRILEGTYVYRAYIEPFDGAKALTFAMRTDGEMELSKFVEQVSNWLMYEDYWCPVVKRLTVHFRKNNSSNHAKLICYLPKDIVTQWLWDYMQPAAEISFGKGFTDYTVRSAELKKNYEKRRNEYLNKRGIKI